MNIDPRPLRPMESHRAPRGGMPSDGMDMDVAWCLTCSVRTKDPLNPYCSEACRAQDQEAPESPALSISITSTIPPQLIEPKADVDRRSSASGLSPSAQTPRAGSPVKRAVRTASRPPITPHHGHPPPVTTSASGQKLRSGTVRAQPRDRRAFSFPALQAEPPAPLTIAQKREARQSQAMMLPFIRKPMGVSLTASPATPPIKEGPNGTLRAPGGQRRQSSFMGISKSTGGANTPMDPDSVFCSTSESEDEADRSALKLLSVPMSSTGAASTVPSSIPLSRRSTKSKSSGPKPSTRTSPPIGRIDFGRNTSQSPVAALVASSASSRSREDIISWARAVGYRPDGAQEEEEERGRPRTRRETGLPQFTPLNEHAPLHEELQAGTTPKGSLSSALAGLGIGGFGVGPIVKALTNSISPHPPQLPNETVTIPVAPLAPEVSPIDVLTSSGGHANDSDVPFYFGGATPTLSTVSFSEAIDPSVNGTTDHAEIVTDDALSTASYARRPPKLLKQSAAKKSPLPLRPITTTATAIWNMTSYIRSLAPFSIASVISPYAPPSSKAPSGLATPAPIPEEPALEEAARSSPLPASRAEDELPDGPPREVVRSLPLDIAVPMGEEGIAAQADRLREKQVRQMIDRSGSRAPRSRSRGRSPSRRRSRSRSAERFRDGERPRDGRRHTRKTSYDADASGDDEEEDDRRGRSRRGKVLARDMPDRIDTDRAVMPRTVRRLSEGGMKALGDRSESRGRAPRR